VANIKSQIKRNRQNEAARVRNKGVRSSLKTSAKRVLGADDGETAAAQLRQANRQIDKAASRGTLHKRAAARRKSRLARRVTSTFAG
jgi:small subunit ribosomal protein S20